MKTSWRRALSALLTFAMLCTLLVIPAAAEVTATTTYDFQSNDFRKCVGTDAGDFTWKQADNTTVTGTNAFIQGDNTYGLLLNNGGSVTIPVSGNCDITVTYKQRSHLVLGTVPAGEEVGGGVTATAVVHYKDWAEGTTSVTLNSTGGQSYILSIAVGPLTTPDPSMKLTPKSVVVKMGETAEVTPTIADATGTAGEYTFAYTTAGIVTAAEAGGKITLTPDAVGTTTVTAKTTVDGKEVSAEVAVRVIPAEIGVVSENTTYSFQTIADGEYYSSGLEWSGISAEGGNGHGATGNGGTLTLHLPDGQQADIVVTMCTFGTQTLTTTPTLEQNTVTFVEVPDANGDTTKDKLGSKVTVKGVIDGTVLTFSGRHYIHSVEVGAFSSTTKPFEAKEWIFNTADFVPVDVKDADGKVTTPATYPDLTITGGSADGGVTHGMAFFGEGSVALPVNGPCNIKVVPSYAWDISLNGSKLERETSGGEGKTSEGFILYYTGNAGTVTLNCGARTWIKSIALEEATPAANIPAKLAVEKDRVSLKLGSVTTSKAEVPVYLRNAEATDVTVASSDTDKVDVSYADGKLTITGKAEGSATVSVKLSGTEAAAIAVTVASAAPAKVAEGKYVINQSTAAQQTAAMDVPGIDWGKFIPVDNTHGCVSEGATTLVFHLDGTADIQIATCAFGTGKFLQVTSTSGTVTMDTVNVCGATDPGDGAQYGDPMGAKATIVGASGDVTVTLTPTEGGFGDTTYVVHDGVALNFDEIWLKSIEITYKADVSGERDIDVWDLAGATYGESEFAFAKTAGRLNDRITPEIWVESGALNNAQFAKVGADSFGDMVLTHNANDRIYSDVDVTDNAEFKALLGGNAASNFNQTFDDGFASHGGFYANGTGTSANRCVTFKRMAAGDKIIAYMGSSQNGDTDIHFQGQGSAEGQEDTAFAAVKTYGRYDFVAEKEGNYTLWGAGGKPFYIRFIRVPAVQTTGTITLPEGFTATDYKVKFVNKELKKTTFATLGEDGTFSVPLAAGYEYTAMLTGVSGFGFTSATKKVTTTNEEALSGKKDVALVVEAQETYTYSGKITGFADGYDTSKLAITMIPEENSGSDNVELELTGLDFTAKLDPGVVYTLELSGVNDYAIKTPESVTSEKDDVTQNIVMEAKDLYTASGKFAGLGEDGKVTALSFENVEDKYTYPATVTADGYTVKLRDGSYSAKATVEGQYSTITHVVVNGKDVEKDLLFVFTGTKPAVAKVKDVYVGYADKSPNFDTVSAAVDAISRMGITAEADRVTVHIAPGTYREQIIVKTPYVTFVNDEPAKGEVLLTWYYGIGYKYYSSNGYYDAQRAYDKFEKKIADRWGCAVRITAQGFLAENITFENSFNRYITEEEIADGVEVSGTESITVKRNYAADVDSKTATERAAAICVEAANCEFYNCKFYSSQDTLYTQGGAMYFKNCLIEGQTDYIFGSGSVVFDACELSWKGYSAGSQGGYITASRPEDTAGSKGYLFRNCTVTGNDKLTVTPGYFGRAWGAASTVTFMNTKLESANLIVGEGWAEMSGNKPENANYAEYKTTSLDGKSVDTSKRVAGTVKNECAADPVDYFGSWKPVHYLAEAATVAFETEPYITSNGDLNIPYPGETFTVNYSLGEANDANDASTIQWYRVAADGTETLVKVSTAVAGPSYKATKADTGCKLKAVVTPTTVSGATGTAASAVTVNALLDGYNDPTGQTDPELGDGVNVFLVGDSTVCLYNNRDEGSWGEELQKFFDKDKVTIVDHAKGGRSSRSFINEGILDTIAANIGEGDYLFIQFGHNDCANEDDYRVERYAPLGAADANGKYPSTAGVKGSDGKYTWNCGGTYKWYLQQYIDVAKAAGATPVLVTPVSRMYYAADGTIRPHHDATLVPGTEETTKTKNTNKTNTYCDAVKQLAQENDILCIDGYAMAEKLFVDAYAAAKAAGETDPAVYGRQIMFDQTHCNKLGGIVEAASMAQIIKGLDLNISKAVKAPSMTMGVNHNGVEVYSINAEGKFSAMDSAKDLAEHAPYWEGVGQKLIDALKDATSDDPADKPCTKTPGCTLKDGHEGECVVEDPGETEKTPAEKLADAIKAAEADAAATKESNDGKNVAKSKKWVTPEVMEAYKEAIKAAKAVAEADPASDDAALTEALDTLNAATKTFTDAKKAGLQASSGTPAYGTGTKSDGTQKDVAETTTNTKGDTVTTVTQPDGDKTITVTGEDGEVLAEVKLPATVATATKFVDVPDDHWAAKAINDMAGLGMVKGVSEDTYDMVSPMTRGAIATIFHRLSNGAEGKTSSFADVAGDAWYADAVGWAAATGVVNGYNETSFGPDDTITRQQLAVMITRYARLLGLDTKANTTVLDDFTDGADADKWATDSLAWCVNNGVMKGRGSDVLDPTAAVTRAEAAVMIDRMIGLIK